MIKHRHVLSIFILITPLMITLNYYSVVAQPKAAKALEDQVQKAYQRAFPASVRCQGYDTIGQMLTGSDFSAIVVAADGLLLSAGHASRPGRTYRVTFPDGRSAIAVALGRTVPGPPAYLPDMSMLKIMSPGPWPFAELGRSDDLEIGEPCIGLSYPASLSQGFPTLRYGKIVSPKEDRGVIQTSVMMEPGDSGGPVFDLAGRLVAINSWCGILEPMNYSVPVEAFKKYWHMLQTAADIRELPNTAQAWDGKNESRTRFSSLAERSEISLSGNTPKGMTCMVSSVVNGMLRTITGTLVHFPGSRDPKRYSYVLTKYSELGNDISCLIKKGEGGSASLLRSDTLLDLALLRTDRPLPGSRPLDLSRHDTGHPPIVGSLLLSPTHGDSDMTGVLSSSRFPLPPQHIEGYLGVYCYFDQGNVIVTRIAPRSPGQLDSLRSGDTILSANGKKFTSATDFNNMVKTSKPGQQVKFLIGRKGLRQIISLSYALQPPLDHISERFPGGKSLRKSGFPAIYVQDAVVPANMCGGPVLDIEGKVIGLNIARFSRTCTLILPVTDVMAFLKEAQEKEGL